MPLSTSMPSASTRLKSTIMFSVMPMMLSTVKLSIMLMRDRDTHEDGVAQTEEEHQGRPPRAGCRR